MGSKHAQDAAGEAHARELAATIAQWRENALVDAQAAFEHGLEQQETRIQFRDRIVTINEAINANPTACTLPTGYRLRINEAIDSITAAKPAEYGKMPAAAETGK